MPKGEVLAYIEIFVDPALMDEVVKSLSAIEDVTEVHEVTGEFDIIITTQSEDMEGFRDLLKNKVMKIKGIKTTVSSIVLKTDKDSRHRGA